MRSPRMLGNCWPRRPRVLLRFEYTASWASMSSFHLRRPRSGSEMYDLIVEPGPWRQIRLTTGPPWPKFSAGLESRSVTRRARNDGEAMTYRLLCRRDALHRPRAR